MKKIVISGLVLATTLFGSSLEDRVSNLEHLVNILNNKVNVLEQKLQKTENEQQKIVKKQQNLVVNVSQSRVMSCGKIKIVGFDYKNVTIGLDKGYEFTFNIKNEYNKTITNINVMIGMVDDEDDTLVQEHLIKDDLNIAPNSVAVVKDSYVINDDLAVYLGETPKSKIKLDVKPLKIKFSDGTTVKCSRW